MELNIPLQNFVTVDDYNRVKYCYPNMNLQAIINEITDASAAKSYMILIFPGAEIKDVSRKDFVSIAFLGIPQDVVMVGNCQIDLQGATIVGLTADAVDFGNSKLNKVTILDGSLANSMCNALEANYAIFHQVYFTDANLDSLELEFAKFVKCHFVGATFIESDMKYAQLSECDFTNCDLHGNNLTGGVIDNCNFTGANLSDVTLPAYANTKETFKAAVGVGHWNATTTIWTDGDPIGA